MEQYIKAEIEEEERRVKIGGWNLEEEERKRWIDMGN